MRIQIVTPAPRASVRGNNITAASWSCILKRLGHTVEISPDGQLGLKQTDCLVALHARKTAKAISDFRAKNPETPIIVCLTGTDVHGDLQRHSFDTLENVESNFRLATQSLEIADRIVVLEPRCIRKIEPRFHPKCETIIQAASPHSISEGPDSHRLPEDQVTLSVIGHLRPVKDPFRAAFASRQLPKASRIKIVQVGEALTDESKKLATSEMRSNPRYAWLGSVSNQAAKDLLCQSHATIVSSHYEGGCNVISDAVVNSIPILTSRMDASLGLLGEGYAGLFDIENTDQLLQLMIKLESDESLRKTILGQLNSAKPIFSPDKEFAAWEALLQSVAQ